jgi:hypothetical protein
MWYAFMSNPRRQGKNGLPTAQSTLDTWKGIVERVKKELGDIPLSTLVQDQQPVADFITKLVKNSYGAKAIKNYFGELFRKGQFPNNYGTTYRFRLS